MNLKNKIESMREGGKALGKIKAQLQEFSVVGTTFEQIEHKAQELIKKAGMKPSFSTVPGYSWATCIMKNSEVCHGIPKDKKVNEGDLITIDIGLINNGFHLDTTITFPVGKISKEVSEFLEAGKDSLEKAIAQAKVGNSVYDISFAMEKPLKRKGYGVVFQLTGHGVGEQLHMDPAIPCVPSKADKRVKLVVGQTLAIENMYTMDSPVLEEASDGWTYVTVDGSLAGMFEETVLVTQDGPEVLT
jgi:methionyl aminopeptidase